ncbi:hypothetical protein ACHAWF_008486 [Thalassiosira exigua]
MMFRFLATTAARRYAGITSTTSKPVSINPSSSCARALFSDFASGGSDNASAPASETKIKGTVKWFDNRKGFGFIAPEDGRADVFVHRRGIRGYRKCGILEDGEEVEFEAITEPDKQCLRAIQVTGPGGTLTKARILRSGH